MWSRHELSRRSFLGGVVAAGSALAACSVASADPAAASTPTRRRGNVRVTNDSFTAHAETCIAVNPRNPRNLLGASIVSGTKGANDGVAAYASFDGGESWRSSGLLGRGDDPTVSFDGAGHGFICTGGPRVWRTDDGGKSFGAPVAVVGPEKTDHPWLAVDRFPGPSGGNLYAVWTGTNNMKLGFTRSTDGGHSFEPERAIAGLSGPGETVVASPGAAAAPHGGVHAIYGVWPPLPPPSGSHRPEIIAHIRVVSSNDFGVTFGDPIELGMGAVEILMPGGAASSPGLPAIAASPRGDSVYAAFVTHQPGADHTDLVIAASEDRGRSWGPPTPVTSGTEPVFYFQPQITVDEAGRVGLSAFAWRDGRVDVVLFVSAPNRLRFGPRVRVTDVSFDPSKGEDGGSKHGAWWIGDYQGLTSTPGSFHPFWNDTRTGALEIFTASVPVASAAP